MRARGGRSADETSGPRWVRRVARPPRRTRVRAGRADGPRRRDRPRPDRGRSGPAARDARDPRPGLVSARGHGRRSPLRLGARPRRREAVPVPATRDDPDRHPGGGRPHRPAACTPPRAPLRVRRAAFLRSARDRDPGPRLPRRRPRLPRPSRGRALHRRQLRDPRIDLLLHLDADRTALHDGLRPRAHGAGGRRLHRGDRDRGGRRPAGRAARRRRDRGAGRRLA